MNTVGWRDVETLSASYHTTPLIFRMLLGEYGWMARRGDPVRVTRYTADVFGYRSLNTIRQLQIFLFLLLQTF